MMNCNPITKACRIIRIKLIVIKKNIQLNECLSKYENPKNSRNSSIPPSKDEKTISIANEYDKAEIELFTNWKEKGYKTYL